MASNDEVPLLGGMSTPGVVRVGDTVRRPLNANSDYVHGLLLHLEECGFEVRRATSESTRRVARF
jgi:hypothetical protein